MKQNGPWWPAQPTAEETLLSQYVYYCNTLNVQCLTLTDVASAVTHAHGEPVTAFPSPFLSLPHLLACSQFLEFVL